MVVICYLRYLFAPKLYILTHTLKCFCLLTLVKGKQMTDWCFAAAFLLSECPPEEQRWRIDRFLFAHICESVFVHPENGRFLKLKYSNIDPCAEQIFETP